jgi:hypothetical protein
MNSEEIKLLGELIAAGIRWLQEPQVDGALLTHHGVFCTRPISKVLISLTPCGFKDGPVFMFEPFPLYVDGVRNTISKELAGQIRSAFVEHSAIVHEWNGVGRPSYSIVPDVAVHPSLMAAVELYRAGCPEHPENSVFCECGWFAKATILTTWPDGWGLGEKCHAD